MIRHHRALPGFLLILALVATASLGLGAVRGAPPPQPPAQPMTDAGTLVGAPRFAPPATEPGGVNLEQLEIYVPFNKLHDVFEVEGRGVFLPYVEYQALWRAARAGAAPRPLVGPPRDALVSQIEAAVRIERDTAVVDATLRIEVFKHGWVTLPLRLMDAAITSAAIDGQAARITHDDQSGYDLLLDNPSDKPRELELKLSFAKKIERVSGRNSVSFEAPQAPLSKWTITAPEAGEELEVEPMLAAVQPAAGPGGPGASGRSELTAFVGLSPTVRIHWTPRAQGATGLEALATVQADQQVHIDEGRVWSKVNLAYQVRRAELSELRLTVPKGLRVVGVADANVKQWTATAGPDGTQEVVVGLFEPAKTAQGLAMDLEMFTGQEKSWTVAVPMVRAEGVGRQQGLVTVQVAKGLRAEAAKPSGLVQVDAGELAAQGAGGPWDFAYRYSALPYELTLTVSRVEPRVLAETAVLAKLTPEELALSTRMVLDVDKERAGVFHFEIELPSGFEVRDVRGAGNEQAGITPAAVESHRIEESKEPGKGPVLHVNLSRKALGLTGLVVELARRLDEKDAQRLLSPAKDPVTIKLTLPRPAEGSVERNQGRLTLVAPAALKVEATGTDGLRDLGPGEPVIGEGEMEAGFWRALAKAYGPGPAGLTLQATRHPPATTVRQLLTVRVEPGLFKFEANFFYDIQFSGLKSLRIDLPADIAGFTHVRTEGVHDSVIAPDPADLAPGYVAWRLTSDREFIGQVNIRMGGEWKIDQLGMGQRVELKVPRLEPKDVERAWGQIALTRGETIDVQEAGKPEQDHLVPIDPEHDLIGAGPAANAARAFAFYEPWSLKIEAVHYDLEEVKRTSIQRAVVRAVLTREGQVSVQGLYRVLTAQQSLTLDLPRDAMLDERPVQINGQRVTPEKGEGGRYIIPLANQSPDQSFLLDVRYRASAEGARLALPEFGDSPAIQQQYLLVYLPEDRAFLGARGGWESEMEWVWSPVLHWRAIPRQSLADAGGNVPAALLASVRQGVGGDDFSTAGQLLLFSMLGSPPAGSGPVTVVSMSRTLLAGLVIAAVALAGLLLLGAGAQARWVAVGLLGMAVAVAGVFAPAFVRAAVDDGFVAAVVVVLIAWLLKYLIWTRPRDPELAAIRQAKRRAKLARYTAAPAAAPATAAASAAAAPKKEGL